MIKDELEYLYNEIDILENKLEEIKCKYFDKKLNLSEKELHGLEKEMQYIKTFILEKQEIVKSLMIEIKIDAEKTCSTYQKEYRVPIKTLFKRNTNS
jgi:hypothetical protein